MEDDRPRCSAKTSSGQPCRRWPVAGATVCPTHGGAAPQVKEAAARRLQAEEAQRAAHRMGLPLADVDPGQALLGEVQRAAGAVAWLDEQVQAVPVDQLPGSPWLAVWQAERERLVRASYAAARAGIEERQVQLAEAQGQIITTVIQQVLTGLNLTREQQALVPTVVPRALRSVPTA